MQIVKMMHEELLHVLGDLQWLLPEILIKHSLTYLVQLQNIARKKTVLRLSYCLRLRRLHFLQNNFSVRIIEATSK